ncbi:MAG: hypothetical protein JOS17DRAFT_781504 [Linnemannia elongata]|nr:MAG: hypothetical protein JOS17DRAFT_781504 [Linnemannia elongata]
MSSPNTDQASPKGRLEGGQPTSPSKEIATLKTPPQLKRKATSRDLDDERDSCSTSLMMSDNENINSDKENVPPGGTPKEPIRRGSKRLRFRSPLQDLETASPTPSVAQAFASYYNRPLHEPFNPDAPLLYPSVPVQPPTPWCAHSDTSKDNSKAAYTSKSDYQASCATEKTNQAAHAVTDDHQAAHAVTDDHQAAHAVTDDHQAAHAVTDDHQAAHAVTDDHQAAHAVTDDHQAAHAVTDDHQDAQAVGHDHQHVKNAKHQHRVPIPSVSQGVEPALDIIPHGTSATYPTLSLPIASDRPVVDSRYRSAVIGHKQARDEPSVDPHLNVMIMHQRTLDSMRRTMGRLEACWIEAREVQSQYEPYRFKRLRHFYEFVDDRLTNYAKLYNRRRTKKRD